MKRVDSDNYYALIDTERDDEPNGPHNIAACHLLRHGAVRIGPQDEGQAAPGGIMSSNPEDIEWFAYRLLELALELRQVQEGGLTVAVIRRRPRKPRVQETAAKPDDLTQRAMELTADGEPKYPSVWINKAHVLILDLVSALALSRQGRDGSYDPYIITERHSAGAITHSVTVEGLLLGEFYCREHLDLFVTAHREARKTAGSES